jgi:hypothetical protein
LPRLIHRCASWLISVPPGRRTRVRPACRPFVVLCNLRDAIGILGSLLVRVGRSELAIGVALVVEAALRLGLFFLILLAVAA